MKIKFFAALAALAFSSVSLMGAEPVKHYDRLSSKIVELRTDSYLRTFKKIVIAYPSVDAQGNEVILSGAIYMNKFPKAFDQIMLYCHQTAISNDEVPGGSGDLCVEPSVCCTQRGTVCFASDYLGFNKSAQYTHPYMNNILAARNEMDMLKAGLVYLKDHGYRVKTPEKGLKTYITGYSQGGAVALATHKAMEENPQLCNDLNFCGSLCAAGPYNMRLVFQKFIDDGKMALPLVLPYVLVGMYKSYPDLFEGIDINEYLSEKCIKANVVGFLEGKPSLTDAIAFFTDNIGDTLPDIMSPEALNLDSDLMKTLYKALDRQNLLDGSWMPTHPIVFYHSDKDDIVSYMNTVVALEIFPSSLCWRSGKEANEGHIMEYINYIGYFLEDGVPGMMKR